ncbi:MAG: ACP S-malonyltransferase [Myxococcales bacterium]|nr:ACP S-malonyltransferase [Myxococcales bacterium]
MNGPLAIIFPGQGSQRAGMASDFHAQMPAARAVFDEASEALGIDVAALCFQEDPRLDLTEFTQPAILTAEIAMYRGLTAEYGLAADCFGGHSLGEYTALCAAGALPLAVAVRLVRLRGALMQRAVPVGEGAMVAVIAPGIGAEASAPVDEAAASFGIDIANRNAKDQVVLSGGAEAIGRAVEWLSSRFAGTEHRLVPLAVSAPFHSRLMRAVEPEFAEALRRESAAIVPAAAARVTSNFTGGFHAPDTDSIVRALVSQISGTVNWLANMEVLGAATEAGTIYEIGPGRPLRTFFQSVGREVTSFVSLKAAARELRAP